MLDKKDIKKIRQIKGMIKGENIKENFECFLIMEGKKGIEKMEKKMKELDFSVDYKNLEDKKWYPLGDDVAVIVLAAEAFGWKEGKLKEFGRYFLKVSFAEKVFIKYFISVKKVFISASEHWERHYNIGILELKDFSDKEKYAILRLKDFNAHQLYCQMLMGFFEAAASLAISSENIRSEEVKCMSRGDKYHEYMIRWQ